MLNDLAMSVLLDVCRGKTLAGLEKYTMPVGGKLMSGLLGYLNVQT